MGLSASSSAAATLSSEATRSVEVPRRKSGDSFAGRHMSQSSVPACTDCSSSDSTGAGNKDTDLQLTVDDKERIRSTWPLVSGDPYRLGARVFLRIFQLAPDARKLFRFDGLSEMELVVNGLFRTHSSRFIRAIDLAVNNLDFSMPLHHPSSLSGFSLSRFITLKTSPITSISTLRSTVLFCRTLQNF